MTAAVPTPLEFVAELADTPLSDERNGYRECPRCGYASESMHVGRHHPSCLVIRAQQVRDAARGAAAVKCRQCGAEVEEPRRVYATPVCYKCLPPPRPLPVAPAPVSPGVGPPAESEDRELVEAVAAAISSAVLAVSNARGAATAALDARAAHLARTVAAVAPVAGPMVGDEGQPKLAKVGETWGFYEQSGSRKREFTFIGEGHACVSGRFDKRCPGGGHATLTTEVSGRNGYCPHVVAQCWTRFSPAADASRALRPAREVAHEVVTAHFGNVEGVDAYQRLIDRITATIERDRAGRGT